MARWGHEPEVAENVGMRRPASVGAAAEWISDALEDERCCPFAIELDGRHVGNVVLDRRDDHLGTARLSIYIGEADARSGGVGTCAVQLAIDEGFGPLRLFKLWLDVHARNARAIATYARCGFRVEGVLRGEFLLRGDRVDVLRMAILRDERP
jgi:RimJ/RimL family protein N-acetyltransferase